jgi:hypothetical protein
LDPIFISTVAMSVLGALASVLVWAKSWRDLTGFEALKCILLGAIVGVLYYVLRVEHGFPDSAVSFAVGYSAKDMIEALVERLKPKATGGSA